MNLFYRTGKLEDAEMLNVTPEQWQEIRAKYGKTREQKIREAVEGFRAILYTKPLVRNDDIANKFWITDKERALRIVEFAVEQLNDGWRPNWSKHVASQTFFELVYQHEDGEWSCTTCTTRHQYAGVFMLKNRADLHLLLSLCGEELNVLKG